MTAGLLRQATRDDLAGIWRVRFAVQENRLSNPDAITDADVIEAIETTGRGWVVTVDNQVVGFAVGNRLSGNIWALFVDPAFDRRGFGRRLHDVMVDWLWSQGLAQLNLSTTPGTRAEGFYRRAGWCAVGPAAHDELGFALDCPLKAALPGAQTC